jgi:hypothetical protein
MKIALIALTFLFSLGAHAEMNLQSLAPRQFESTSLGTAYSATQGQTDGNKIELILRDQSRAQITKIILDDRSWNFSRGRTNEEFASALIAFIKNDHSGRYFIRFQSNSDGSTLKINSNDIDVCPRDGRICMELHSFLRQLVKEEIKAQNQQ